MVYWMQAGQREPDNHALEYAVLQANRLKQPLFVFFILTPSFPESSVRHYVFMLQGLEETRRRLAERRISMVIRTGEPPDELAAAADGASLVVTDRGYLNIHRRWRNRAAELLECPLVQVETDAVVPVDAVYDKEAWSAAVLRRRILRVLFAYLQPVDRHELTHPADYNGDPGPDISDPLKAATALGVAGFPGVVPDIRGGTGEALDKLTRFIEEDLDGIEEKRNDPGIPCASGLSPYLHFGQISPLTAALAAAATGSPGKERFLEELIVRRELALNFTRYNGQYDRYDALPSWALRTLSAHASDRREYLYSAEELEAGKTHDRYWNAAQRELVAGGTMHGYMRMYWGKKILEWSSDPRRAFETALVLNNRYALDGRDPNSYAGVAWCFGKHDRPWKERDIFGSVRYMNEKGLERKFHMQDYLARIEKIYGGS